MTNILYDKPREYMVTGGFNWPAIDVLLLAWTGSYKVDPVHRLVQEVVNAGGVIIKPSLPVLDVRVYSSGYCQTGPVVVPLVPIGPPIVFVTLSAASTPVENGELIAYYDDAEGLPYTPNGLDVVFQPDWLSNRAWFRP